MSDITTIDRLELRHFVERATAVRAGTRWRRFAEQVKRTDTILTCCLELDVGEHMLAELAAVTTDLDAAREDLWQLRPTWAWVWTAEASDPATWARGVRWARQVARQRADHVPLARFLGLYAARRGETEARTRMGAARGLLDRELLGTAQQRCCA